MPTVLFLSWRDLGHPDAGGAEVFLDRIARHLAGAGWAVTVFSASHAGADDERVDEIRYVRRGSRFTVYPWGAWLYLRGRLGRPDVIVDVQNGLPFLASAWSRRPVVVLCHHVHERQWTIFFGRWLGRLGWWIESRLAPRLQRRARYVTVSCATQEDLVGLGVERSRIAVVHNGTEQPVSPAPVRDPVPRLVVLGRLVPHKRVELAIDTVARLRPHHPGLHLDVIGDGAWRPHLEVHAARAGVTDHVTFHGHVHESEKVRLLHRAWVMLLPSVKEGWGLVLMEAAALGVPAVAFREAGGVTESIIDGRTGHLVDDPEAFAARVGDLLADPVERGRLGAAARDYSRGFTWGAAGAAFEGLLTTAGTPTPVPLIATRGD